MKGMLIIGQRLVEGSKMFQPNKKDKMTFYATLFITILVPVSIKIVALLFWSM